MTESEIRATQDKWVKAVLTKDIETMMGLYAQTTVLKPTLSNVIRCNRDDIQLYFEGGEKYGDVGFFNQGIVAIEFFPASTQIFTKRALDIGSYKFKINDGREIEAHYTFGYEKFDEDQILMTCHHSSLFVD